MQATIMVDKQESLSDYWPYISQTFSVVLTVPQWRPTHGASVAPQGRATCCNQARSAMVATQPHSAGVVLRIKVAGGEFEGSVGGVEIHAVDPENRRLRRAEQALRNFPKVSASK